MKIYPTNWNTIKYAFHILIVTVLFEVLFLVAGQYLPVVVGFKMPALSFDLIIKTILSSMTILLFAIIYVADMITHTILKME